MGYWKSKVLPKIKKVFEKNNSKKDAAAEASKSFDASKEDLIKELEEKKSELHPKVIEIYEATSVEIKTLVKEPKEAGLKKHSTAVQKFLQELLNIEFPGAKTVCEASSQYGPALVPGPVFFIFEKVSTFIVAEDKAVEPPASEPAATEEVEKQDKEIAVEEDKKEEEEKTQVSKPAPEPAPKVEEAAAESPKP